MSKHTNDAQRLRTLAINIRWADEPLSAMSLRLAKAASDPRSFRQGEELWPDGPPNVQLGSLEPGVGYLRRVEGRDVGYVPEQDLDGAVRRVATKADVFGIDAPIVPGTEASVGMNIKTIIDAGCEVGAKVVPYLASPDGQISDLQRELIDSLVPHGIVVQRVLHQRCDPVSEWMDVKNEALPHVPHNYLDGAPLADFIGKSEAERSTFQNFLLAIIRYYRGNGFIASLLE